MKLNDATEGNNNNLARPGVGTERADDAPFSFLDDPIAEIVSEGDHDDPAAPAPKSDKANDDAPIPPAVQAQLDKMAEQLEEHRQTAQYLKGQNSILETQLRGDTKKETPPPEPLLKLPDKAALQKALSDPDTAVDALTGMFTEFGNNILERLNKIDESSRGEHARRDRVNSWRSAMAEDRKEAIDEFGEATLNDPAFIKEADAELAKTVQRRGGRSLEDVQPGDFSAVASRVYARWMKAGRISGNGNGNGNTNGNGDSRRPTLREISREISSSDRLGSSSGARGGSGGAKSIADLGMSPRDTRIAQAAAKRMGVSEEAWVRNYQAGQAEDEGYGR